MKSNNSLSSHGRVGPVHGPYSTEDFRLWIDDRLSAQQRIIYDSEFTKCDTITSCPSRSFYTLRYNFNFDRTFCFRYRNKVDPIHVPYFVSNTQKTDWYYDEVKAIIINDKMKSNNSLSSHGRVGPVHGPFSTEDFRLWIDDRLSAQQRIIYDSEFSKYDTITSCPSRSFYTLRYNFNFDRTFCFRYRNKVDPIHVPYFVSNTQKTDWYYDEVKAIIINDKMKSNNSLSSHGRVGPVHGSFSTEDFRLWIDDRLSAQQRIIYDSEFSKYDGHCANVLCVRVDLVHV
ncbi:hypothetical protein TKK_0017104 [Trichogramma kaykai]